jgi:hypothetical protein
MPSIRSLLLAATVVAATRAFAAGPAPADASARKAAAVFTALEKAEVEKLSILLDGLIADPVLVKTFVARDREKLLAKAQPKFETLRATQGVTHWYFLDPEPARTCFLRVHSPTLFGDMVRRETLSQAIATHEIGFGKELGKTAFALRVVKPIRVDGKVVGYMELGEEIEHFLGRMKEKTGDDFALLVDKKRLDRKELLRVQGEDRWEQRPDVVLIDSTVWNERLVALNVPFDRIPAEGVHAGEWTEGSHKFVGAAFAVRDAADRIVGALFVRHELTR